MNGVRLNKMTGARSASLRRVREHLALHDATPALRTAEAMRKALHLSGNVRQLARILCAAGEAYIDAWVYGDSSHSAAAYRLGVGESVARPKRRQGAHEVNVHTSPAGERVRQLYGDGRRLTPRALALLVHIGPEHARALTRQLHDEGWLFIESWERSRAGRAQPVYARRTRNSQMDAPFPPPMTVAESRKRQRDALTEKLGQHEARCVLRAMAESGTRTTVVINGVPVYRRGSHAQPGRVLIDLHGGGHAAP